MIAAVIEDGALPGVWHLRVYDGGRLMDDTVWSDERPASLRFRGRRDGRTVLELTTDGCVCTVLADTVDDRRGSA